MSWSQHQAQWERGYRSQAGGLSINTKVAGQAYREGQDYGGVLLEKVILETASPRELALAECMAAAVGLPKVTDHLIFDARKAIAAHEFFRNEAFSRGEFQGELLDPHD
jgi:hypothetical protein